MGRVWGRCGYIILLIILIILYKYIYYIIPPLFWGPPLRDTKALFLQLQLQMQILTPLHSMSTVVGGVIVGMG